MAESKSLTGQVALVTGGGEGVGRAVALALAARGASVVVTGKDERALAETVGEIACGAGKARHVAGDDPQAAVDRAIDVFGRLDVVVADQMDASCAFQAATPRMAPSGRLIVTSSSRAGALGLVREPEWQGACNAIVVGDSPEKVAEVAVFLCSRVADGITGRVIEGAPPDAGGRIEG